MERPLTLIVRHRRIVELLAQREDYVLNLAQELGKDPRNVGRALEELKGGKITHSRYPVKILKSMSIPA